MLRWSFTATIPPRYAVADIGILGRPGGCPGVDHQSMLRAARPRGGLDGGAPPAPLAGALTRAGGGAIGDAPPTASARRRPLCRRCQRRTVASAPPPPRSGGSRSGLALNQPSRIWTHSATRPRRRHFSASQGTRRSGMIKVFAADFGIGFRQGCWRPVASWAPPPTPSWPRLESAGRRSPPRSADWDLGCCFMAILNAANCAMPTRFRRTRAGRCCRAGGALLSPRGLRVIKRPQPPAGWCSSRCYQPCAGWRARPAWSRSPLRPLRPPSGCGRPVPSALFAGFAGDPDRRSSRRADVGRAGRRWAAPFDSSSPASTAPFWFERAAKIIAIRRWPPIAPGSGRRPPLRLRKQGLSGRECAPTAWVAGRWPDGRPRLARLDSGSANPGPSDLVCRAREVYTVTYAVDATARQYYPKHDLTVVTLWYLPVRARRRFRSASLVAAARGRPESALYWMTSAGGPEGICGAWRGAVGGRAGLAAARRLLVGASRTKRGRLALGAEREDAGRCGGLFPTQPPGAGPLPSRPMAPMRSGAVASASRCLCVIAARACAGDPFQRRRRPARRSALPSCSRAAPVCRRVRHDDCSPTSPYPGRAPGCRLEIVGAAPGAGSIWPNLSATLPPAHCLTMIGRGPQHRHELYDFACRRLQANQLRAAACAPRRDRGGGQASPPQRRKLLLGAGLVVESSTTPRAGF